MALTLRAVLAELDRLAGDGGRTIDEIGRDEIVDSVARAALLGARGNSGVILSQLIRGAAEELVSPPRRARRPGARRRGDGARGRARLRLGPRAGRGHDPHRHARDGRTGSPPSSRTCPTPRLAPTPTPTEQDARIADVLERALEAGEESVKRGPELLPVLREAGVVDAGGYARHDHLRRRRRRAARRRAARRSSTTRPARVTHPRARVLDLPLLHELRRHRRRPATPARFVARARGARRLGPRRRRPHDAEGPRPHRRARARDRRCSTAPATVSRLDVADMHEQVAERDERLAARRRRRGRAARCGALAVVAGDGHAARCSTALGAHVARRRPDAEPVDLRPAGRHPRGPGRGGRRAPEQPQRGHGRRARRRAVREGRRASCRRARSRPGWPPRSRSSPTAPRPRTPRRCSDGARRTSAPARVAPGGARRRARAASRVGDAVGFVDEELVAWGEPGPTLARGARPPRRRTPSCSPCIAGDGAPLDDAEVAALAPGRRRARAARRRPAELVVAARRRVATVTRGERPPRRRSSPPARLRRPPSRSTASAARRARALAAPVAARRAAARRPAKAREAAEALGPARRSATCSSTCRATAARRAPWPTLVAGRAGDRRRRGPRRSARARCAGAACGRSSRRPSPTRPADEGRVLQPAVARAQVPARHAARAARQVPRRATASASARTRRRREARGAAEGEVAHYPATDGITSTQILALVATTATRSRDVARAAARAPARRRAAARPARGAVRRARRRPRGRPPAPGLRRAAARPARPAAPPRAPPRGAARRRRSTGRAS